ncbi:MAG: tRNA pseudouridine(55) synthase TruB [Ruminococcaceae bacterium]|nr:tRNA pseudouridine(55) synthase TruB [Oscillospiraceae bacterium]
MTGIIPLKKSENMTSFLAVKRVRGITGEKKCGHTGTLDPMATGVLPVALGGATRFIELLPTHIKAYKATFRLGIKTDTLDIWGEVTEESKKTASIEQILEILPQFTGKIKQVPPMYSALKKDGVRLYELARQGIEVERQERECEIFKLEISQLSENEFSLFTECSAGTYIRSLIGDIGECLNTGATMTSLNRTYACGISEDECITLEELENYRDNNALDKIIVPVDKMLMSYPDVTVTKAQGVRFKNGGELLKGRIKGTVPQGLVRVYCENEFLGLGESLPESENLTVKRVYVER